MGREVLCGVERCPVCKLVHDGWSRHEVEGVAGTRCPRMDIVALAFVVGRESVDEGELIRRIRAVTPRQASALRWLAGQDGDTVDALVSMILDRGVS